MMTSVTRMGMNSGWLRTVSICLPEQRSPRELQERLGIDAHAQGRDAGQGKSEAQAEGGGESRCLFQLFTNEHAAYDLEIVIDGHRDIERRNNGQTVMFGLDQRQEDVVLAEETRGGRDAGQREQEDQHQEGVPG